MLAPRPALRAHAMILYRTTSRPVASHDAKTYQLVEMSWDALVVRDDLPNFLLRSIASLSIRATAMPDEATLLPPIGAGQEVWAAGVTYFRSRDARMEEAEQSGGARSSFYDRVYSAPRRGLFSKAALHRL